LGPIFLTGILLPKHRAYYRSGRPVIKIGPKGALGSHEIRPIHSAPCLGQSIPTMVNMYLYLTCYIKGQAIVIGAGPPVDSMSSLAYREGKTYGARRIEPLHKKTVFFYFTILINNSSHWKDLRGTHD